MGDMTHTSDDDFIEAVELHKDAIAIMWRDHGEEHINCTLVQLDANVPDYTYYLRPNMTDAEETREWRAEPLIGNDE
jgi:hypothetical protein